MKIFNIKFSSRLIAIISLIVLSVTLSSCSDYLEEHPVSNLSAKFTYNTKEGLQAAVVALYNINRSLYTNGEWENAMAVLLQAKSDLALARTGEISLYGTLVWGASLKDFGTTRYDNWWKTYYKIVSRSNKIIQSAKNLKTLSDATRNQILSEAKTWRAYSYFTLFRLFHNIYLTTTSTTPQNAFNIIDHDSPPDSIYALINKDLDFAIDHLSWESPQFGRITQGVARTIKSKVDLWQKNWKGAKKQAEAIIKSGAYKLVPNTADVFKNDLKNSETIWAIQFAAQTEGGGPHNLISWNYIPQYTVDTGDKFDIKMGGNGAGFVLLNKHLINLLKEDPNDMRDKGTYYIMAYTYNNLVKLPQGVQLGDTIRKWSKNSSSASERKNYYARLNPGCLKFVQWDADPKIAAQIENLPVYRFAETYLIAAEANMHLGNISLALKQLNKVRKRAHAHPLTHINRKIILQERARELAFEGQRWYTLKRMGVLYKHMKKYAGTENDNGVLFQAEARKRFKKYMVNWPIPKAEIHLLGPDYPQNKGY